MPKKKKGGSQKSGSEFFRRYEGALDSGYAPDEAAAIAHSESIQRGARAAAAGRKLRESMFPHLKRHQ